MLNVTLERISTSDHGSVGVVFINGKFFCYSMERPERYNNRNISCIPEGTYTVKWCKSPRYGWCYQVTDVKGRSYILIHPGNYGGDTLLGFRSDTNGCLIFGKRRGTLTYNNKSQIAVLVSRPTIRKFNKIMQKKPFKLTITRGYSQ